jgi:glutamine amidotransferase
MIAVLDYGIGNLASVCNMVRKAGGHPLIARTPADVLQAEKLLLPGVGHFDHGMAMLNASGVRDALDEYALGLRRPVLGICLGAQILGRRSEEGKSDGLGWLDMECERFPTTPGLRVPHMGWNAIVARKPSPLLAGQADSARFYFVHSYKMRCAEPELELATADYGGPFTCAVQQGNIAGTQFHPEKSLRHGLALMRAFVAWTPQ